MKQQCSIQRVISVFNNFTQLYPTVSSFRRERELRKDPIVVSSTSGRHLKLYDLALLEIDLNWVDWVRAIKKAKGTNFCGQSVFYQGYVPIYAANCIAISPYHQCLKFTTPISSIFIFASPLPPLQHSTHPAYEKNPHSFMAHCSLPMNILWSKFAVVKRCFSYLFWAGRTWVFLCLMQTVRGNFWNIFFNSILIS